MADYELIGLNEAAPDLRAPTSADTGVISNLTVTGVLTSSSGEVVGAGTDPEQVPLNQNLGGMAYQSPESVVIKPQATAIPAGVGDMTFQATSDSIIELEYKGSDAVVRTAQVPMNNERLAELSRVTPLRQAVRVAMTGATSGSNGIQVLDNATASFGTGNFSLQWEGVLPDWTPASDVQFMGKRSGTTGYIFYLKASTQRITLFLNNVDYQATAAISVSDTTSAKISVVVVRETALVAGSVTFYVNGVQLGSVVTIPAASPATADFAVSLYVCGTSAVRYASDTQQAIIYNRALTAAEVLSLCVNGPALADIGASQVPVYTSDFSVGVDGWAGNWYGTGNTLTGNRDSIDGEDDWLEIERTGVAGILSGFKEFTTIPIARNCTRRLTVFNPVGSGLSSFSITYTVGAGSVDGPSFSIPEGTRGSLFLNELTRSDQGTVRFIVRATGTAATGAKFYVKNATITLIGITGQWNAEDAQSNTGQIFDSSGNKNHALLPAAGATIIGKEMSVPKQVRWTNTWAGTNELQYIGGVNQAILPDKAYIDSIIGTVTGATPHDIIIGDGSDTDRYVTITTGLAAGTTTFTLANRTTDGTNLKLTVDPDTNSDMSIAWVISYRILE